MNGHSHTVWNFKGDYAGNVTVKAQWGQYTVTYNANGGSGAPSKQTGIRITLSDTVPTRSGYAFLGWSTDSSATSASYQPGNTYTLDRDLTLYAVWEERLYLIKDGVRNMTFSLGGQSAMRSDGIITEESGYLHVDTKGRPRFYSCGPINLSNYSKVVIDVAGSHSITTGPYKPYTCTSAVRIGTRTDI